MPTIIRPPRLAQGSRLGVIATSSPIDELDDAVIARGYARLAEVGLEVVEAPNCRRAVGHTAGTIEARVQAIHDFLTDPSIDALMAFWGGHQTHQLLEYLDFELFAAHPKPIIGYSDLTPLLNVITARCGLVTFSGPAVITFAKPTLFDYTVRWFERVLFEGGRELDFQAAEMVSTNLWYEREDLAMLERPSQGWKTYAAGVARGRLFGGNLGSLLLLSGTPYWPDLEGTILFVEEDEVESPETIDRLFTRLRQMGVYDQVNGMVIGRFPDSVEFTREDSLRDILDVALRGYDIPVLYDVDFGHTDPLLTLPIGVEAELDAAGGRFRLLEPWNKERP
ncbi:LD-carboxypeptidase [Persicimonas caeni]|uniref:LD-carboxypeptidase n=1 Tax=Persicimonas caeni TaxID=2292766 RepID=A0A4Y6PSZ4_PERCE|nr:S66 peptidase family protein [Persicimonas caeni]QDG51147.1 LD-carboxypeptidase [Persicimonas caeni]QED32368.1 LD-carboxypeptidase [Persicimonas caeni]